MHRKNHFTDKDFSKEESKSYLIGTLPLDVSTEETTLDDAVGFGLMQVQLIALIDQWDQSTKPCYELQQVIQQRINMFDEMKKQTSEETSTLSRRQAIAAIAMLPVSLLQSLQQTQQSTVLPEELLPQCAASITACWDLTNGTEMSLIGQVLSIYHPKLVKLAQQHSKCQSQIADLVAQGFLLNSLVALDQLNLPAMEEYSKLAVQYSQLAENYNLQAVALKQQATMFLVAKNPGHALQIYQRTLPFIKQISPLLRSRVYQGLASASARCGRDKEDAKRYLGLAYDTFPDDFENDPSFLYADSGLSVLHMYAGLTYLDLDQPEDAWDSFAQVDGLQPKIAIGEFTQLEFLNLQTRTAIAMRDQERSCKHLEAAVKLANTLDCSYGHTEAYDNYQHMRLVWHGDSQIKDLVDLF